MKDVEQARSGYAVSMRTLLLVAQDLLTSVAKSCAEHTLLVLEHLAYRTGVGCAKTYEGFGGTWIERLSLTNK